MRHTRLHAAAPFSLALGYSVGVGRRAGCIDAVEAYDAYEGTIHELAALIYDGLSLEDSDRLRQLNDEAIERLVVAERKTAICLGRRLKPVGLSQASRQGNAKIRWQQLGATETELPQPVTYDGSLATSTLRGVVRAPRKAFP
jgi:hypothetical protein